MLSFPRLRNRMQQIGSLLDLETSSQTSFGNTDWIMIRQAGLPREASCESARSSLCEAYWLPVFRFILRRGFSFHDAQDLAQEFFTRLLERNCWRTADQQKGKFRSFLLTLLKRFLADQKRRSDCQRRGGAVSVISLDSGDTEFRRRMEPSS